MVLTGIVHYIYSIKRSLNVYNCALAEVCETTLLEFNRSQNNYWIIILEFLLIIGVLSLIRHFRKPKY